MVADSVEYGWRVPAVKWLMVEALFTGGVGIYVFYALQPYVLELWGDPDAYQIAGIVAAIVAGRADPRRAGRSLGPRPLPAPYRALILHGGAQRRHPRADRARRHVLVRDRPDRRVGAALRGVDADPAGVPQRAHPVTPARDDPVVQLADELERGRVDAARAGSRGGRLGLRLLVPDRRRDLGAGAARARPLAAPERAGGHRTRRSAPCRPAGASLSVQSAPAPRRRARASAGSRPPSASPAPSRGGRARSRPPCRR